MSDSDQITILYKREAVFGVKETTDFKAIPVTGESLAQATEFVNSQQIRSDRQISQNRRVRRGVEGAVNFEFAYGAFDDFLEAALLGTWTANVLTQGTTFRSFTLQRVYNDLSNEAAFFLGCSINQMSLSVAAGAIITGEFSLMGTQEQSANPISGTNVVGYDNPVMTAAENIDDFVLGDSSVEIMNWTMQLQNNLRTRPKISSLDSLQFGKGKVNVTGTVQMYFATRTLYDLYLNSAEQQQQLDMEDANGNSYAILLPRFKFTSGRRVAGGENQDIIADMSFQAFRDVETGNTIQITRTASA